MNSEDRSVIEAQILLELEKQSSLISGLSFLKDLIKSGKLGVKYYSGRRIDFNVLSNASILPFIEDNRFLSITDLNLRLKKYFAKTNIFNFGIFGKNRGVTFFRESGSKGKKEFVSGLLDEVAVAVAIAFEMKKKNGEDFQKLSNAVIFEKVKDSIVTKMQGRGKIEDRLLFEAISHLKDNENLYKDGLVIIKDLGSDFNLKDWKIHQGGTIFNAIKNKGATLSNLTPNRWNPSDLFFIHKNFDLQKYNNLYFFNSYIAARGLIRGYSLKNELAMHGSYSWTEAFRYMGIEPNLTFKKESFLKPLKDEKSGRLSYVVNKDGIEKFKKCLRELKTFSLETGMPIKVYSKQDNFLKKEDDFYEVASKEWAETVFGFFGFVEGSIKDAKCDKERFEKLEKNLELCYNMASSTFSKSCPHRKCQNAKIFPAEKNHGKIIIEDILIPVNGCSNIYVKMKEFNKDGRTLKHHIEMQFRSKGSTALFNIMHNSRGITDSMPIVRYVKGFL